MGAYAEAHRRSLADPDGFWGEAAAAVDWERRWDRVLDRSRPPFYRWFAGARMSTCWNALDRHVAAGRGDQLALIYDSPLTGRLESFTYARLTDLVARAAGALAKLGLGRGDRAILYMPMIPEAVIAMLACARLGAIHSVVFGGFAPPELASRIDDARPKLVIAGSCGVEPGRIVDYKTMLDAAIAQCRHKPEAAVIVQRPERPASLAPGFDHDWAALTAAAEPVPCVTVEATDPLYIIYTSGTTGQPKGIVRDQGGHAVALTWSMRYLYDVQPGEVFWAASDVGWVVGHSYIVYGPLMHGCTSILYEGKPVGTPDAGAYWRVIAQHGVASLFTAPTAFRAIKRDDPDGRLIGGHDLSRFRSLFLAGERSDPDTVRWAQHHLKVPVVDHWWQTETGWEVAGNPLGLEQFPVKPGSATKPLPGWDLQVLDADARPVAAGDIGELAIRLPLPPGSLPTLWQADQRFCEAYLKTYPGYYKTGDAGYFDEDGYVHVMTRIDDVINVAGHRLSTGQMEEVLASHPAVAECAVIGKADALKGELPLGLLVLKAGTNQPPDQVVRETVALVRDRIGPVAAFRSAVVVDRLPKTRSGKILRGTIKAIADGTSYKVPATIDDPAILDAVRATLAAAGLVANQP